MKSPRILGAGGAHVDRRGRVDGAFIAGASNPGTMREETGGGVLNALRNARLHGVEASILSVRGGDSAGEAVARTIADAGIEDLSAVFLDRTTPSYTAILDGEGELVAALADMALYELAFERQMKRRRFREATETADAFFCDANMPRPAIAALLEQATTRPVFAIAISPAKVERLQPFLGRLSCLFMNRREAEALSGKTDPAEAAKWLRQAGLASGVVTSGAGPLTGFDADGIFRIAPPPPDRIVDVTGAGDALAGTATAHLLRGSGFAEAVRAGMAASMLTVANEGAVASQSAQAFATALSLVPEADAVA